MTSLGLLIGHMWSFLIITVIQWLWVLGFLFLVEEPELVKKFGMQYKTYRQQAPMLFPKPVCAFRVLTKPLSEGQGESAERGA
jgi:protein-S-isoprenylcysteine O-methyltransferase Ste14